MEPAPAVTGTCTIEKDNWLQKTATGVDGKVWGEFLPQTAGFACRGCGPNYQATYTCGATGRGSVPKSVTSEDGYAAHFDCTKEDAVCRSGTLELKNGGNLYFSVNGSMRWKQQYATGMAVSDYSAAKSKYGTNTLVAGQSLRIGEFVGSPSGDAYLTVVKQGNKVKLVVARREGPCKKQWSGQKAGLSYASDVDTAAAVYKMALGPISTEYKGRIAYIDNNNERQFYTDDHSQVAGSDKYYDAGKFAQPNAAAIRTLTQARSSNQCKIECNKIDECYGFIHDRKKGTCELKGPEMFPNTLDRVAIADAHMFVRLKKLTNPGSCSSDIVGTEGSNFNTLPEGRTITGVNQCNVGFGFGDAATNLNMAESSLGTALASFARSMAKQKAAEEEYAATLAMHEEAQDRQETVNGMETSAGYDMVSSNYQFMVWTTIALLAVIGGIRVTR